MPAPHRIAASILAADFANLGSAIAQAEAAGVDWIHVDVMDGHFVPNLTLGPVIVAACRRATALPLDVHLMIDSPERLIPEFVRAGATGLTVHVETCPHLHRTVQMIRESGARAGVALNPATPASAIGEILEDADLILAMTVNPGYAGQRFLERVLPKVQQIRGMIHDRGLATDLQVDGGIDPRTAPLAARAGANVFVAATAIFGSGPIADSVRRLRQAVELG